MILNQATGLPSSLHGHFLKHHIEALTIKGVLLSKSISLKTHRQNTLKSIRIIEGTLRSINNLLERFHQSFFFYFLANENSYISIGNYMPPLGLLLAPLVIQILCLWIEIHKKQSEYQNVIIKSSNLS
jgi:GPI-anchor transamidase subunit GAA1